jgi:hypothetical protein
MAVAQSFSTRRKLVGPAARKKSGATAEVVAPLLGELRGAGGETIKADKSLATTDSRTTRYTWWTEKTASPA